jgi:hypothetical protein
MLLTFAELHFLVSLADHEPALPLLELLEHPVRQHDDLAAAGLASLVARELCREFGVHGSEVYEIELDHEIVELHAAVHSASISIQVTTVSPDRCAFWLLLIGRRRAAFTPVGAGVFGAVVVPLGVDLRDQVVSLVSSALVDDPAAGVAITRGGRLDAMSFRTNDELGGPDATPDDRRAAILELVDGVFAGHHPSIG